MDDLYRCALYTTAYLVNVLLSVFVLVSLEPLAFGLYQVGSDAGEYLKANMEGQIISL